MCYVKDFYITIKCFNFFLNIEKFCLIPAVVMKIRRRMKSIMVHFTFQIVISLLYFIEKCKWGLWIIYLKIAPIHASLFD